MIANNTNQARMEILDSTLLDFTTRIVESRARKGFRFELDLENAIEVAEAVNPSLDDRNWDRTLVKNPAVDSANEIAANTTLDSYVPNGLPKTRPCVGTTRTLIGC